MNYNRVNNLTGWAVCILACTVYLLTMERSVSFWDTGEYISSAYKLQIPHPPGAPLFILLGRFFIILFGNSPATAAIAMNSLSAIVSGLTILFLFWTITYFARKLLVSAGAEPGREQLFTIMSAGVVGALAYTFSDSFWFSAVEGEVYALSSLFTAIVFWMILKWEQRASEPGADRWLVQIFFIMGLSIGIHLLNLLVIPAIVMVYYFRKYKPTIKGSIIAFLIGCVITGSVMKLVIQSTVKGAGSFDVFFVNELGMPFFSGFAVFFLLLAALLILAIRYASRKKYYFLKLGTWCILFMLIGYSTYITTMIRSSANPGVDMFNVDNPISLQGYLGRDQYGDWPILYGPDFTDRAPVVADGDVYVKGKNKYETAGKMAKMDWGNTPSSHVFPRMWDPGNDRNQVNVYRTYAGLEEGETPSMADNVRYLATYQTGWMYMRYFMWNFAGRQNDLQGFGNARDSNWISGISFLDNALYGKQSMMPDSVRSENKSYNRLFMLPLALGIAGMIYQYRKNRKNFLVNGLLFFFTGLAIVLYLNQAGTQPRERDYAYVGSFYAFAVWIGLGLILVRDLMARFMKKQVAAYLASAACMLGVPALMAHQEWDDHDRSQKTLARDMAKAYLESCPPNAILFTYEDNDTYPLWYAQEVEGIRPDVRVMVNTLVGTDWYMNQLRYKMNESAPFDLIFTKEQTQGNNREIVYHSKLPGYDENKYYDLYSSLKNIIGSDDPKFTAQAEDGQTYNLTPVRKFTVPVNKAAAVKNGVVKETDSVVSELKLDLSSKNYLLRSDLTMLAIIATSNWQRPVCFTSSTGLDDLGLGAYGRQEGMIYRLVPLENSNIDTERSANYLRSFDFGRMNKAGTYLDEENRRRLNIFRLNFAETAIAMAEKGEKEKARELLQVFEAKVNPANLPYGFTSNRGNQHNAIASEYLRAAYITGDMELARKITVVLKKDLTQQLRYYRFLGDETMNNEQLAQNAYMLLQGKGSDLSRGQASMANDILSSYQILRQVEQWEKENKK
jgi:hypothetical protein